MLKTKPTAPKHARVICSLSTIQGARARARGHQGGAHHGAAERGQLTGLRRRAGSARRGRRKCAGGSRKRKPAAATAGSIDRCAKRCRVACHHEGAHDQRARSMERSDEARLAVLIDADNTSVKWADAIFEEIATLGEASVRRIYGTSRDRTCGAGRRSSRASRWSRTSSSPTRRGRTRRTSRW